MLIELDDKFIELLQETLVKATRIGSLISHRGSNGERIPNTCVESISKDQNLPMVKVQVHDPAIPSIIHKTEYFSTFDKLEEDARKALLTLNGKLERGSK